MKAINITKLLVLSICAIIFASCDKMEDAVTIDVPLENDINVKFNADVLSNQQAVPSVIALTVQSGQNGLSRFSGSMELNRNDEAFEEIRSYLDNLSSIDIEKVLLTIQEEVSGAAGYSAENIQIKAEGASGFNKSFNIPSYQFGDLYNNDDFTSFVTTVVLQLMFTDDTLILRISGETNAIEEDTLNVYLTLQEVVLKVKTLQAK